MMALEPPDRDVLIIAACLLVIIWFGAMAVLFGR